MDKHRIVGLITARQNSKQVPGKNIKLLAGKPLITWSIEAALNSRHLDRVVVSTDGEEIAEISRAYGAEVPFLRPENLARDDSAHILSVLHAIDFLEREEGYFPEAICLLQPTSPLRLSEDIDGLIDLALDRKTDAVVSVTASQEHPVFARKMDSSGILQPFIPCEMFYPRRQDLPDSYFVNGAVYFNRTESLKATSTFYPPTTYGYVMPVERSMQIDTPWDFRLAELVMKDRQGITDKILCKTGIGSGPGQ